MDMNSSLENSSLSNLVWEVDIASGIVSCEDLPYHFKFTVREYKENGEVYKLSSSHHMESENIHLHQNNDEIDLMMRIASSAFMKAVNNNIALRLFSCQK